MSDAPARTVVDERPLVPVKLDQGRRAELLRRKQAGTLTVIPAGSSLQSYVQFDGSGSAEIGKSAGRHFILSFDGQVLVTDGKDCESLEAKADGMTAADLVLPTPVPWKDLPLPPRK